jgi:uncharacterized protein (TIGR03437 family)
VEVRPSGLIFAAAAGSTVPLTRTVRLATATPGNVEARAVLGTFDGAAWLDAGPRSVVVAPASAQTLSLQTTPGTLAAGVYRGAMTVLFNNNTPAQVINVLFQVLPAGTTGVASQHLGSAATCIPQQLRMVGRVLDNSFQAVTGWPRTIEVEVRDDCGNNIPNTTNSSPATVVASFSNGDSPLALVHVGDGVYHSSWQPAHAQPQVLVKVRASALQMQGAELTMQGRVDDNPTAPAIYPGGIVQSASYTKGAPLAPGGIVALFGRNLATGESGSTSLPLPTTLAGATVTIAGQDAPLFYVHSGQLNVQIPSGLAPNSRVQAMVKVQGQLTVPESITLAPASPGIFTVSSDGSGQGVIFLGDRLADGNSPARAGDVLVVYCTGLGATQPPVAAGQASPASPPATATAPVTATIGGRAATVQFAGLTPGLAGLYQVNVQVPEGVSPGAAVELVLTQNGIDSNKVTLAIR